jgi:ABC-2 type transport system permease protein
MVATTIKQAQTFTNIMQMLVIPMLFLSGALYPIAELPTWLGLLSKLNPLTYAVDPMRRLVFHYLDVSPAAVHTLSPGVTWWGWRLTVGVEVVMVAVLGVAVIALANLKFTRTE